MTFDFEVEAEKEEEEEEVQLVASLAAGASLMLAGSAWGFGSYRFGFSAG